LYHLSPADSQTASLMDLHFMPCMSNLDNQNIFIVVPVYNEGPVLRQVAQELHLLDYTVIIVDDGSISDQLIHLQNLPVHFLRHQVNLGQGAALQTGIEYALQMDPAYIVTFDGDGQHDPHDISIMIGQLKANDADIVFGSRFLEGSGQNLSLKRKLLLQFARFINFLFTGELLSDAHNGLRVMNPKAAGKMKLRENRMAHATEIISIVRKNKLRYAEVPVNIRYTNYSRDKGQKLPDAFRIFFDLLLNKIFG
jgi:glycosyltransferase involved in cell wall biosynthesis